MRWQPGTWQWWGIRLLRWLFVAWIAIVPSALVLLVLIDAITAIVTFSPGD